MVPLWETLALSTVVGSEILWKLVDLCTQRKKRQKQISERSHAQNLLCSPLVKATDIHGQMILSVVPYLDLSSTINLSLTCSKLNSSLESDMRYVLQLKQYFPDLEHVPGYCSTQRSPRESPAISWRDLFLKEYAYSKKLTLYNLLRLYSCPLKRHEFLQSFSGENENTNGKDSMGYQPNSGNFLANTDKYDQLMLHLLAYTRDYSSPGDYQILTTNHLTKIRIKVPLRYMITKCGYLPDFALSGIDEDLVLGNLDAPGYLSSFGIDGLCYENDYVGGVELEDVSLAATMKDGEEKALLFTEIDASICYADDQNTSLLDAFPTLTPPTAKEWVKCASAILAAVLWEISFYGFTYSKAPLVGAVYHAQE